MTADEDGREPVEPETRETITNGGGEAEPTAERQPVANSEDQPEVKADQRSEAAADEQAAGDEQPEPAAEGQDGVKADEQPEPAAEGQDGVKADQQPQPAAEGQDGVKAEQQPEPAAEEQVEEDAAEEEEAAPRVKPAVPGAHLEVDIVPEGVDPLGPAEAYEDLYAIEEEDEEVAEVVEGEETEQQAELPEPIATAAIDLAAGARYRATGKRKTAIARVTLRPGTGAYLINGRALEAHFPRITLQRNIRQPLETVGYQERMDVVARLAGGGISAQAGALRHGVSRALLEADPNLRGELKRRGFLTRDSRVKERKKAGLKKARKRPQFSKR
jgi:small subunit ribosomal protein S9